MGRRRQARPKSRPGEKSGLGVSAGHQQQETEIAHHQPKTLITKCTCHEAPHFPLTMIDRIERDGLGK